jgi:hypothetical protein
MLRTTAPVVLASLVVLLSAAPAEAAATVDVYTTRGGAAEVHLSRFDPTGTDAGGEPCGTFTEMFVSAHEHVTHMRPGSRLLGREVSAGVWITDTCTGATLLSGDAYQADAAFDVKGTTSARLEASLSLHDYVSGTDTPLAVSLSLTAKGPAEKASDHTRVMGDGTVYVSRDRGVARLATVTGSISLFGRDVLAGANVDLAAIAQLSSGSVSIRRN